MYQQRDLHFITDSRRKSMLTFDGYPRYKVFDKVKSGDFRWTKHDIVDLIKKAITEQDLDDLKPILDFKSSDELYTKLYNRLGGKINYDHDNFLDMCIRKTHHKEIVHLICLIFGRRTSSKKLV